MIEETLLIWSEKPNHASSSTPERTWSNWRLQHGMFLMQAATYLIFDPGTQKKPKAETSQILYTPINKYS